MWSWRGDGNANHCCRLTMVIGTVQVLNCKQNLRHNPKALKSCAKTEGYADTARPIISTTSSLVHRNTLHNLRNNGPMAEKYCYWLNYFYLRTSLDCLDKLPIWYLQPACSLWHSALTQPPESALKISAYQIPWRIFPHFKIFEVQHILYSFLSSTINKHLLTEEPSRSPAGSFPAVQGWLKLFSPA